MRQTGRSRTVAPRASSRHVLCGNHLTPSNRAGAIPSAWTHVAPMSILSANPPPGPQAYSRPRGEGRYEPTRATESPWDREAQHGGPPAALLAHVIDKTVPGPLRIGRISVDILGSI